MNKVNYQKILDGIIEDIVKNGERPRLLMHACCAPCSSYVIEYLSRFFEMTLYFYNPNIFPEEEYIFRSKELERLLRDMKGTDGVALAVEKYNCDEFYNAVRGYEECGEGGSRCRICYGLRLEKAARYASEHGFDYFTTTLSISPYKNSGWINEIGEELSEKYRVRHLASDFKKNDGYKRSIELSKQYGLYRQDYCGCEYSRKRSEDR